VPSNEWKQSTLGAPIFRRETYQAGIGQGYDVVTPIQLINAYAAARQWRHALPAADRARHRRPDGTGRPPVQAKIIHKMKVPPSVLRVMRNAARNTVLVRHTYNLVDMPIKVAGKSGTAEFGTRDSKGRLPLPLVVRRASCPRTPGTARSTAPSAQLVVLALRV
jgi:penicillin-binding protein 2